MQSHGSLLGGGIGSGESQCETAMSLVHCDKRGRGDLLLLRPGETVECSAFLLFIVFFLIILGGVQRGGGTT
jgi:hypothetical protein